MIQYKHTLADIAKFVDKQKPTWRASAAARTKELKKLGHFKDGSPDWADVKPVLMRLQGENKCIYCERKFGSEERSLVEHDVEHFRPKGNVDDWKVPATVQQAGIKVAKAPKGKGGYHLLAFNLDNYSASCKTCNTILKKDRFPISGSYQLKGTDPRKISTKELPLLLYPFGDQDIDPESVITFEGYTPRAVLKKGRDTERAQVTIAFFELDSEVTRGDLFFDRAKQLVFLWDQLERSNDTRFTAAERTKAKGYVDRLQDQHMPHAACSRAFVRLYGKDRAKATLFFQEAEAYFNSKTGG